MPVALPTPRRSHARAGFAPRRRRHETGDMESLTYSASVVVRTSPEALYDLVSDVTRTGEWSPVCRQCSWDEGASGQVGDWFTGRNDNGQRQWETRSQVVAAEPGREFAWMVG